MSLTKAVVDNFIRGIKEAGHQRAVSANGDEENDQNYMKQPIIHTNTE